ncbi:hypothetical protein LTR01_005593 [Friedmanniomyces endolithicus]|nr:hypothetical protein LTS09_011791 [Friedmanniomyces endolithicus]KAK0307593.1 hypothetical protein LTR01_005593 [Friedmanniomyces endolithicus]KAK0836120.1 hypothetical protein LTR73_000621 [Friedmanniomyces endolithicus]
MFRLPKLPRDPLRPDQQELQGLFHSSVDGTAERPQAVGGPFPFFAVLPEIGRLSLDMLVGLGEATQGVLPLDAREVVSLVCAAHFGSVYATQAHTEIAMKLKLLSHAQCQSITAGEKAEGMSEVGNLAYETAYFLLNVRGPLSQELWDQCLRAFGKEGTVGLVHYVALCTWTSIALNAAM